MPTEHHLNATPFSATDQERPFMATVYPFSKGLPAGDNGLCYKALIISRTFQKKTTMAPVYSAGLHKPPEFNATEHL